MMHDFAQNLGHKRDNVEGKNQMNYLKHCFNGPAGLVPWLDSTPQHRDNLRYSHVLKTCIERLMYIVLTLYLVNNCVNNNFGK